MRLCLLIAIAICATSPCIAKEPAELKVMTFNIRFDGGAGRPGSEANAWLHRSGNHRRDLVTKTIAEASPDILGLQEALSNQVQDVQQVLESFGSYSVGRDDGKQRGEHCSIFFRRERFDLVDKGTFWLCPKPDKPGEIHPDAACVRIASWVRLNDKQAEERELVVMNTHWDHVSRQARRDAAHLIRERLAKLANGDAAVLMGDLNTREKSVPIQTLTAEIEADVESESLELTDSYRQIHPEVEPDEASFQGFTARTEGHRIDFLFHTPQLTPLKANILQHNFDGRLPSDHYPVMVNYRWKEG